MKVQTKVKTYNGTGPYRRDAKRMGRHGWRVVDTSFTAKRRGLIGSLFYWLFFGWLFAMLFQTKAGKMVVTYQRSIEWRSV